MTEKLVGIYEVEIPNFTMRIFARRGRFTEWFSYIAEVTPKLEGLESLPEPFEINGVLICPHRVCAECSFKAPVIWLKTISTSRFILSGMVAEKLIPSISKRQLLKITHYGLYTRNEWSVKTGCKELIVHYLICYRSTLFKNSFPLNKEQKKTILEWTKKWGGVSFEDDITIKISDWWLTYERAGWLLLALRIVAGEYIIPCKEMEDEFQYFIDNGQSSKSSNLRWTGGANWQYHFEKLPYFDGGMIPS